jgi:hypothetical protein
MLRYRCLLIDTEAKFERPVQAFFDDLPPMHDWARRALAGAGDKAEVVFYKVTEKEIATLRKADLKLDSGSAQSISHAG